jgi:signal transduction histidine kinase
MTRSGSTLRHVLLVEDNPGDADLACERLAEADAPSFRVTRASTLSQAIELLEGAQVDAIILDLNLPDSQGVDTVRRIRVVVARAPIIAISGLVTDALRSLALREGADELFDKLESNSRLFWRSVLQIIDRRQAQHRRFQALVDATPDAILLVNQAGQVRYVNEAAMHLFVRSREELMTAPLAFAVRESAATEIEIPHPGGSRACEMRVVRIDWDEEDAYIASIRDITERKQAEALQAHSQMLALENQRMEAASRMKSQFLANMSHELRTPLNAIIGFSQMLQQGMIDSSSPRYPVFVGHIVTSAQHLLKMINEVLDLAKIEAGKVSFDPTPVDLQALTQDVVSSMTAVAMARQIEIALEFDASLQAIEIDATRFKQILYNYLSNALKFSRDGGTVTVRLQAEDEQHFRLAVRDMGEGVAPGDIAKLFGEFQQLDAGLAKRHQGTGLGLALTKRLVEAQGGTVGMTSVLGQGSEFFAVLPRKTDLLSVAP